MKLLHPEWLVSPDLVPYSKALAAMEARVEAILNGEKPEQIWLLEHPALYTAGTSAQGDELRDSARFPVFQTGRGGRYTYHGPGQRVVYALIDLRSRGKDLRAYICRLEEWLIRVLADFGIRGERREGRVGIWVVHKGHEEKIAAIGVRVRRWVAYHGVALNVQPDLTHFSGIIPCGIAEFGVTSLHALGVQARMEQVDAAFQRHLDVLLGSPDTNGQKF